MSAWPTPRESEDALHDSGLAWVTSHVWRHTVATLLDEAGLTITEIADQLGNHTFDTWIARKVQLGSQNVIKKVNPRPLTWGSAPPVGLEPTTLRLTAECSAN